MQTIGIINAGITLIIENTLPLGADQVSKIKECGQEYGPINGFQLDLIKKKEERDVLVKFLKGLQHNTDRTIFLFASPEALQQSVWQELMQDLTRSSILRLVCIDEVHQFVDFGLTFRYKFAKLKKTLFKHIIVNEAETSQNSAKLKVPVLFMTATFNEYLLKLLEKLTGC